MKATLKFFFVIGLSIFLSNCKKGECLGEYLISPEDLKIVPFSGTESLLFVKENDTVRLECWYKRDEIRRVYPYNYAVDYYLVEESSTRFTGEDLDLDLWIHHSFTEDYSHLSISFRDLNDEYYGCTKGWPLPLYLETYPGGQWIEDSLTIQGFTYHNVFCDSINCQGNELFIIYYTKEYGVVKYEFEDGSAWELLEIDWNDGSHHKIPPH
ncbi:MAG TPA: hypothetical protein VIN10_05975 [Bacteroidales bacterium]